MTTHDSESHKWLIIAGNKAGNNRVIGTFSWTNLIGVSIFEYKTRPSILEADARAGNNNAGSKTAEI